MPTADALSGSSFEVLRPVAVVVVVEAPPLRDDIRALRARPRCEAPAVAVPEVVTVVERHVGAVQVLPLRALRATLSGHRDQSEACEDCVCVGLCDVVEELLYPLAVRLKRCPQFQ